MKVSEIMTTKVVTASELTEIRALAALMLDHDIERAAHPQQRRPVGRPGQ